MSRPLEDYALIRARESVRGHDGVAGERSVVEYEIDWLSGGLTSRDSDWAFQRELLLHLETLWQCRRWACCRYRIRGFAAPLRPSSRTFVMEVLQVGDCFFVGHSTVGGVYEDVIGDCMAGDSEVSQNHCEPMN